jgi:hypothetical protein
MWALHGCRSVAVIMGPSLANAREVHGQSAFTCDLGVALPVSRRRCHHRRKKKVASGWRHNIARTPVQQYQLDCYRYRGVKGMSQCSSCGYSMIIRLQLAPALHCVSWVHITTLRIVVTTVQRNMTMTCISIIVSGCLLCDIFYFLFNMEPRYGDLVQEFRFILYLKLEYDKQFPSGCKIILRKDYIPAF